MVHVEVVKGNGKFIPQVVKLWVERYEKAPKPAMVELLMMLFEVTYKFLFKNSLIKRINIIVIEFLNPILESKAERRSPLKFKTVKCVRIL